MLQALHCLWGERVDSEGRVRLRGPRKGREVVKRRAGSRGGFAVHLNPIFAL